MSTPTFKSSSDAINAAISNIQTGLTDCTSLISRLADELSTDLGVVRSHGRLGGDCDALPAIRDRVTAAQETLTDILYHMSATQDGYAIVRNQTTLLRRQADRARAREVEDMNNPARQPQWRLLRDNREAARQLTKTFSERDAWISLLQAINRKLKVAATMIETIIPHFRDMARQMTDVQSQIQKLTAILPDGRTVCKSEYAGGMVYTWTQRTFKRQDDF